jgi:hypothetical protein
MLNREPKGLEAIRLVAEELWSSSIDLGALEALSGR